MESSFIFVQLIEHPLSERTLSENLQYMQTNFAIYPCAFAVLPRGNRALFTQSSKPVDHPGRAGSFLPLSARPHTTSSHRTLVLKPATASKISEHLQHAGLTARDSASWWVELLAGQDVQESPNWHACCILSCCNPPNRPLVITLITSTIRLTKSETANGEIVRVLRALIEPTRVETGCLSCGLYKDLHDPKIIIWVEDWNTQDDLERHLRSRQYKKILAAFDMSDAQPDMRFDTVVETKGMQLIAEARGMKS